MLPKQLSSSLSFLLEFEFRPVLIYLQSRVWFFCLHMVNFGGKSRPVAVSRSTLIYGYRDYETRVNLLTDTGLKLKLRGKHEFELSCSLTPVRWLNLLCTDVWPFCLLLMEILKITMRITLFFTSGAGCIWGSLVLWTFLVDLFMR